MSTLATAQQDITALSGGNLKEALKRFDKAPNVGGMGMFTAPPDELGTSMRVLKDVTTMVEYCSVWDGTHYHRTDITSVHLQCLCKRTPKTVATRVQRGTGQHYWHWAGKQDLLEVPRLICSF